MEYPTMGAIHDNKLKQQQPTNKQSDGARGNTALIKTHVVWYLAVF
jgi:hypothetical protein